MIRRTCKHEIPVPLHSLLSQRICPPCLVKELIRVLKLYLKGLEKRGGVFQSKEKCGHKSDIIGPWRKCKVELLNTVQRYRDLLDGGVDSDNEEVKRKSKILLSMAIAIYERDVEDLYRIPGIVEKESEPEFEAEEHRHCGTSENSDAEMVDNDAVDTGAANTNAADTNAVCIDKEPERGTARKTSGGKKWKREERKRKKKEEREKLERKIEATMTEETLPDVPSPEPSAEVGPTPRTPRKVIINDLAEIALSSKKGDVIQSEHSPRMEPQAKNRQRLFKRSPWLPSKSQRWKSPEGMEWVDTSLMNLHWRDVEAREHTGPYGW